MDKIAEVHRISTGIPPTDIGQLMLFHTQQYSRARYKEGEIAVCKAVGPDIVEADTWHRFHIYLTTHEEPAINEKCLYINGDGTGREKKWIAPFVPLSAGAKYKIVATTDSSLWWAKADNKQNIKAGTYIVPSIGSSFIEKYIREQGAIKQVYVEYERLIEEKSSKHVKYHPESVKLNGDSTAIIKSISNQLPLDFILWYSGMDKEKVLKAYERWQKEKL